MAYTPQTINPGDVLSSDWANKIEQEIARRGSFMGVVNSKDDLPADPATGDWYITLKGEIFVWDGSKWQKVGGSVAWVSDTLRIDLAETYLEKTDISGTVDGANTSFTLTATPIWPGTVTITVDDSTTITDNGDGTLSDGGTIDYDTGAVSLASAPSSSISAEYHQAIWDGVKWYPIGASEDFPSKIEVFVSGEATSGSFEIVANLYDENDVLLVSGTAQTITTDDEKHTVYFAFEDFSSLTLPDSVIVQIEVKVPPSTAGIYRFYRSEVVLMPRGVRIGYSELDEAVTQNVHNESFMYAISGSKTIMDKIVANDSLMNTLSTSIESMNAMSANEIAREVILNSPVLELVADSEIFLAKFIAGMAGVYPGDYSDIISLFSSKEIMDEIASDKVAIKLLIPKREAWRFFDSQFATSRPDWKKL